MRPAIILTVLLLGFQAPAAENPAHAERLRRDLQRLRAFSRELADMERGMRQLQKSVPLKERGHYTAAERDAIEGLLFRYLNCRESLWDIIRFHRDDYTKHDDAETRARGFLIGFGGVVLLFLTDLRQVHAQSAQFFRYCGQKVSGVFQFFEVLVEEFVVPVVARRPLHAALE